MNHRAALASFHRPVRGQGDFLKLAYDVDSVDCWRVHGESSLCCCADLVHVKVQGIGVRDGNVLGILSPISKMVSMARSISTAPRAWGRDLIDDQIRVQKVAHHISS